MAPKTVSSFHTWTDITNAPTTSSIHVENSGSVFAFPLLFPSLWVCPSSHFLSLVPLFFLSWQLQSHDSQHWDDHNHTYSLGRFNIHSSKAPPAVSGACAEDLYEIQRLSTVSKHTRHFFLTQPQWKQGSRLHNVKPPQQGELQALQLETNGSRRREKHQIWARHPHSRLDMSRLPQPTGQLSLTEMKQDIKITFPEYSNIHLPRVANPCRFTLTSSVQSENCVTPPDCMKSMPTVS